jgi:hypothetical protein
MHDLGVKFVYASVQTARYEIDGLRPLSVSSRQEDEALTETIPNLIKDPAPPVWRP